MSGFVEFVSSQRYEFILLGIVVLALIIFLKKNREKIHTQKILSFGPFALISMILVRTGWGISLMDSMAKKHPLIIKIFAFTSVILGFLGMLIQSLAMFWLVYILFHTPQVQGVTLALPFTNIPYLGYLSFSHWIVAIFIMASVHEFAHGVVARYYKIPVTSSGFAVLNIILPIIPAAFVEPEPKKFEKTSPWKRYAVLTAGPVSNILLAIPFFLLLVFIMQPIYSDMTHEVGMSFGEITQGMPAEIAGVRAGQVYTYYNGQNITNALMFFEDIQTQVAVGDIVTLGYVGDEGELAR
ncbi:MAG: site-2 protease family protein, partial [Candidatus Woesearchaeota archaeon]